MWSNCITHSATDTQVLFGGGKLCIVTCKSPHKKNHWAKIRVPAALVASSETKAGDKAQPDSEATHRGELVELWGPVGEYEFELKAYQWHFGVQPCKYPVPQNWALSPLQPVTSQPDGMDALLAAHGLSQYGAALLEEEMDMEALAALARQSEKEGGGLGCFEGLGVETKDFPKLAAAAAEAASSSGGGGGGGGGAAASVVVGGGSSSRVDCRGPLSSLVFSVDNADTMDVDDALSFEFDYQGKAGVVRMGIHIADVASRIPCSSPLFAWAKARASSCYHGGVGEDDHGSVPMLPHELAHGDLSLNQVGTASCWIRGYCCCCCYSCSRMSGVLPP
jgi:hypothetical protein